MSNKKRFVLLCGCEDMCKGHMGKMLNVRIMTDISIVELRALNALVEASRELRKTLGLPWQKEHVTELELGILLALAVVDTVREDEAQFDMEVKRTIGMLQRLMAKVEKSLFGWGRDDR